MWFIQISNERRSWLILFNQRNPSKWIWWNPKDIDAGYMCTVLVRYGSDLRFYFLLSRVSFLLFFWVSTQPDWFDERASTSIWCKCSASNSMCLICLLGCLLPNPSSNVFPTWENRVPRGPHLAGSRSFVLRIRRRSSGNFKNILCEDSGGPFWPFWPFWYCQVSDHCIRYILHMYL